MMTAKATMIMVMNKIIKYNMFIISISKQVQQNTNKQRQIINLKNTLKINKIYSNNN
jgi:hypothetical protein